MMPTTLAGESQQENHPIKFGKPGEFPGLATQSPEAAEESLKKSATGKHIISAYEKKKHSVDKA